MRKLNGIILVVLFFFFSTSVVYAPAFAAPQTTQPLPGGTGSVPVNAFTTPEIQNFENGVIQSQSSGQPTQEDFTHEMVNNTGAKIVTTLVGGSSQFDQATGQVSALQSLGTGLAMLYNPPASTKEYVADLLHDSGLNIAQPAYAQGQGLGFSALSPVLATWKIFRNVAYFFYVIIFLVIGFMILFRQKIGNQTAVGVQQALPKIIISLLAVTFSYAIAGLLIDIMYLAMFFIVSIFQPSFTTNLQTYALNSNIFQLGGNLLFSNLGTANNAISSLVNSSLVGGNLGALGGLGSTIAGLTFAVVFAIALVFQIFRLFFELLKTYISIIIGIVLSPLALMLGALPGNNAFSAWLKTLVANLAVFPAVLIIIVLSLMLTNNGVNAAYQNTLAGNGSGGFLPPYLIGAGTAGAVQSLLGLGVLLILPDVVAQVKKSLGGSGGIFEQFANNFTSALDKGWKGGELVPGVGLTNTNQIGMSGNNLFNKAFFGTKESNERVKNEKFNVLGRGFLGESYNKAKNTYINRDIIQHSQPTKLPRGGDVTQPPATSTDANKGGTIGPGGLDKVS